MEWTLTSQTLLGALLIFFLRLANMSLDTLRVMFIVRGGKLATWLLGFVQSVIFVIAFTYVLNDLSNPLNITAYAAGFATGNVIGMWVEERLAVGYVHLRIISPARGTAIVEHLRAAGYAVTEVAARGKDGMVTLISCSVRRKEVVDVDRLIREIDANAFVTAEDVRRVWRGFWRSPAG